MELAPARLRSFVPAAAALVMVASLCACGQTPATRGPTVEVTVRAPFLVRPAEAATSVAPSAVPSGADRVNVTAYRLGEAVATTTLSPGLEEATLVLAPGASYDFAASVTSNFPSVVEIAWGQVSAVAVEGSRIDLTATSIVHGASLGEARYEGVEIVVPLSVLAPNGQRVPPTDYDVTYAVSGATLVESTHLGARVRPDGSGDSVEVVGDVVGMNAAHETGAVFPAVRSVTPNDPSVGFDFVAPDVWISTVPTLLVNQPVVLAGNARDNAGVVRVEVYVNVSMVGEAAYSVPANPLAASPWSLPWVPAVEGEHVLSVLAYDARGNVGRADLPIVVHLAPPVASGAAYTWMAKFPELRTDHVPAGIAMDGAGDLYLASTHQALPAEPHDFNVGVVSKHRADGATYWVRQYEGQFHVSFAAVTGVADGVVVAGWTAGSIAGVTESGTGEAFLMKLGAAGDPVWATRFQSDPSYGANASVAVLGLAANASGDIYAVGATTGVSVRRDVVVARFAADGQPVWQRTFGATSSFANDEGVDIVLSSDGSAFVVGSTTGHFAGFENPTQKPDVFVARVTPAGDVAWVTQFGTSEQDWVQGVALSPSGGVLGVAVTLGTFPGASRTTAPGNGEGVVFRVDGSGELAWLTQFATNINTWPRDLVVDPAGSLHVVGSTRGAFPGTSNAGGLDVLYARFSDSGALESVRQFGSERHDQAWRALWHEGAVFVVGDADFDSTINDRIYARRFLARITP